MKENPPTNVSLAEIAKLAGVSKASASLALQNRPGIGRATREKIKQIAQRMGYLPDARIASLMATVRDAKAKALVPLAWLNSHSDQNAWQNYKFLSPFLEGAKSRAKESGYRIEEIWTNEPGTSFKRISKILYHQGIEGVIITHPLRHLRLEWDHFACVSLDGSLLAPRLDRVMADLPSNLVLAYREVKRLGYERIGVCLGEDVDRNSAHTCRAITYYLYSKAPKSKRIKPLFYSWGPPNQRALGEIQVKAWLRAHRPDVIIGHSNRLVEWAEEAGRRVPQDVSIVHTATDDDVSTWAGVCSNRRVMGAAAVEWIINLIQNRRFGLPKVAINLVVRGSWQFGDTLLVPRRPVAIL